MSAREKIYHKLPGTGHQIGSYTKLYRAADHLLQVSSVTFTESYKRFYFRDIQAFIVLRTNTWLVGAGLLGLAALLTGAGAIGTGDAVGQAVFGTISAVFLLIAIVVLLQGPSCQCWVKTAVQTERIPSLSRLRRANKVLAELQPLLAAAQGPMPAETVVSATSDAEPFISAPNATEPPTVQ